MTDDPYYYTHLIIEVIFNILFGGYFWHIVYFIIFLYIFWILDLQDKISKHLSSSDTSEKQRDAILKEIARLKKNG